MNVSKLSTLQREILINLWEVQPRKYESVKGQSVRKIPIRNLDVYDGRSTSPLISRNILVLGDLGDRTKDFFWFNPEFKIEFVRSKVADLTGRDRASLIAVCQQWIDHNKSREARKFYGEVINCLDRAPHLMSDVFVNRVRSVLSWKMAGNNLSSPTYKQYERLHKLLETVNSAIVK